MSSERQDLPSIPPPTNKKLVVKDKLYLILQLTWLFGIIFPWRLLVGLFRKILPPPGKSLEDKIIIVTGAGHGLGQGLAQRFAEEGAKVAVVDINKTSAIHTAQIIQLAGGIAKPYFTNIARAEEIHQLQLSVTEDLGPVDILVNNAGIIYMESLATISEAEVRSVMEVNLLSHFWMAQEFLPEMKRRNSGHIVAICSMSAMVGLGKASAYTASRSGLMGFMESLRIELEADALNIKTTTVFPYFINTSENYVNQWDIRVPPVSIQDVVDATVTAVKREQVVLSVPEGFYNAILLKLLPIDIQDKFFSIIYFRVYPPTNDIKDKDPSRQLIQEIARKRRE